jgi:RNA-directed DNA polymerase
VHEPWWLWLADVVLFHDPREERRDLRDAPELLALVPPHKSLFNAPATPACRSATCRRSSSRTSTSTPWTSSCKHQLRARHYVRYVDDFILLHESPQWLNARTRGSVSSCPRARRAPERQQDHPAAGRRAASTSSGR